jgi:hypothetical protein
MSTRSTEKCQYEDDFDGMRTHEVGRARVYLKGKVLVVAAHLDGDRVDARAGKSVQ